MDSTETSSDNVALTRETQHEAITSSLQPARSRDDNAFFTANNIKARQGYIGRDELVMTYETNQPTHITPEWCVPCIEDGNVGLVLGFNVFTSVYRAEQHGETCSAHAGSEEEPNVVVISYYQYPDTSSDVDEGDLYVQAYKEDSVAAHTVNKVEVVYQDEYKEGVADWEWSPSHTMCSFDHMALEQETRY